MTSYSPQSFKQHKTILKRTNGTNEKKTQCFRIFFVSFETLLVSTTNKW